MRPDCILIATLPSLNNMEKVERVFKNSHISEVRFNTGVQTAYSIEETLEMLKKLSIKHNKKLWIDIKGRQLRVTKWADPLYSCIELSHRVQVLYPAQIYFRNGDRVNITHIKDGNKLFVDPLPRQALGAGQSVNIIGRDVEVEGYLTEKDKQYLSVCRKMDLVNIMASFVENFDDLVEILHILPNAQIVSKIESLKGISFISEYNVPNLMAARDDLYLQSGQNYSMLNHLKTIIETDSGAICASKIFQSLEKRETVDFADYADLELMYNIGYRKFMLCDNVCNYSFEKAIQAWEEFIMGGSNYDRDVYGGSSSDGWGFGASSYSTSKLTRASLDSSMKPNGKILKSNTKSPIIVVLDVTGSNIDFARVVYDKLPMFYGQIEQKGYLKDFDVTFCAVGDAYTDNYLLQIGEFAKGIELDSWLEKIVLESGGGGQKKESYELAAYYLFKNTKFAEGSEPIIFFIGDEKPYPTVNKSQAEEFDIECKENGIEPFKLLREKVNDNVFMLLNKYCSTRFEDETISCWENLLAPEHVVKIGEEKAIVDLMLGIISMVSSTRTLETYKIDMLNRGQTQARIECVSKSLSGLSTALVPVKVSGAITKTGSGRKSSQKGKRL